MLLEIKRISITRLKLCISPLPYLVNKWFLEIKRISITRLKQELTHEGCKEIGTLEIKRISITRLKPLRKRSMKKVWMCLKSKESRLRDWNQSGAGSSNITVSLEIKRISITRLKLGCSVAISFANRTLKSKESRLRDWNWRLCLSALTHAPSLEIKRISITRLKQNGELYTRPTRRLEIKRISITRLKL